MTIVIDSSVLIAALLTDESLNDHALQLFARLNNSEEVSYAPVLFRSEIASVLRKAVYQRRITHDEGMDFLREALAIGVTLSDDDALYESAFAIAAELGLARVYDAQYLALARRHDCILWTADLRLVHTAERLFPKIRWLGDLS